MAPFRLCRDILKERQIKGKDPREEADRDSLMKRQVGGPNYVSNLITLVHQGLGTGITGK